MLIVCLLAAGTAAVFALTDWPADEAEKAQPTVTQQPTTLPQPTAAERLAETERPDETNAAENLFAQMPEYFCFSSGAGGWSTELNLSEDGTFTGFYHDADMGDGDPEKCPNGTVHFCQFSGSFTEPVKIDDYTWSVHVQSLEYAEEGTESYGDGRRYITSIPYGLEHADEVLIYLPGHPTADIPEEVLFWLTSATYWADRPETLPFYALNNVSEQMGFFSEAE